MRFPSASQQLTFSASEKGRWFKRGDRFSVLFIFSVLFFLETASSERIITPAFCWCLHDKGCQESERTLATKESEVVSWTSFSRGHFEKDERWFFNFQPLTESSNSVCFSQKYVLTTISFQWGKLQIYAHDSWRLMMIHDDSWLITLSSVLGPYAFPSPTSASLFRPSIFLPQRVTKLDWPQSRSSNTPLRRSLILGNLHWRITLTLRIFSSQVSRIFSWLLWLQVSVATHPDSAVGAKLQATWERG